MPASSKTGVRVTALALACCANAALFCLLWFNRSYRVPEAAVPVMIWIAAPDRPRPPPQVPPPTPPPDKQSPRPASVVSTVSPAVVQPATEPGTAITVPPIDWYAEGERVARNAGSPAAMVMPKSSLDSKPQVLSLPDSANLPHKLGDSEQFEGGDVITWINERCYYKSDPLENMQGGPPRLKLPICKTRSMKARRSEASATALQEEMKPQYLREPLPLPRAPPSPRTE
jgi:hypothetical protein